MLTVRGSLSPSFSSCHKTKRSELIIAILSTKGAKKDSAVASISHGFRRNFRCLGNKVFIEFRRYFLFHLFKPEEYHGGRETKLQGKERNLCLCETRVLRVSSSLEAYH